MSLIPFSDFFGIPAFEKNAANACHFFQRLFPISVGDHRFESESQGEGGDKSERDKYSFFHLSIF